MGRRKRQPTSPVDWKGLTDEELLRTRVRDLGLRIEGSAVARRVERLYAELDARGIAFRPGCYLADEWLCPDKEPVIGIPFYLAHPRLIRLEKRMMLEVEGGTESSCMKILRHEAGHAVNYAYVLYRRTRWRELFGPFSARYSDSYKAQPYSRRYVSHLQDNYAQAHPDEDFAETFAVWVTPEGRWEQRYRGWPVMPKLRYVDRLMKRIGPLPPRVTARTTPWSAARMTSTLAAYYQRKRRTLGEDFPGFYDPGLQRLFGARAGAEPAEPAGKFLRRWRTRIVDTVARWTGQRKFDIDRLVGKLIRRCDDLGLSVHAAEAEAAAEVASFVTAVMNRVHGFIEDSQRT